MSRSSAGVWLVDLGIGILGLLVTLTVLRVFRFDDPRILYNAWTYCLAIPTVIISSMMLAHVLIPQSAERSIQTGFLLSVLVHLGLTLAAINTVLFSGLLPDGSKSIEAEFKAMASGTSFQSVSQTSQKSAPDYLRPVQNQIDPSTQIDAGPIVPAQPSLELLDAANEPSVDVAKPIQDKQLAQAQMLEPAVPLEQAQALGRPDLAIAPIPRATIQAQDAMQTPVAQDSLPEAKGLSRDRILDAPTARLERSTVAPSSDPLVDGYRNPRQASLTDASSATAMPAELDRIERELGRPMENTPPEVQSPPLQEIRTSRLSRLLPTPSRVPLGDLMPSSTAQSQKVENQDALRADSQSLGDLLGSRGELSGRRARPSASSSSNSSSSNSSAGSIEYSDPLLGRIASAAPMRSAAELPSISDVGVASPGLDRFRSPSNSTKQASKGLVPIPAPAFQQRSRRMDESSNQELKAMGSLGPRTEESIERGLEFLAKHQRSDGAWRLEDYGQKTIIRSDTAATALSLLSFQGAGYSHVQFKYQRECRKALEFLVAGQQANGDLYRPMDDGSDRNGWLYSHAIATLALCEAYGMTQDENLRTAAQRAVDFLVYSQDRQEGGWRYAPRVGSDTSVTGWGMMALKSAELAGLYVPKQTYEGIQKWLDHSQASARERFLYRYNWLANTAETKHGAVPTPVMTSVGLLMRLYTGWHRDDGQMAQGADWLLKRLPAIGTKQSQQRDTYYWYYATQVLFHMGGDRWKTWYESLYPMLIETQVTQGPYAGSWEPLGPTPDAWGEYAGRLYVTTMNLLSLEVTYRHLPIYEAASR